MVCAAIRPHVQVPIDVHLMVEPVDELVPQFAKAGANIITFHPEASRHVHRTLSLIRDHRSEEHTSELQSLMRISYAVFCLKNKNKYNKTTHINHILYTF